MGTTLVVPPLRQNRAIGPVLSGVQPRVPRVVEWLQRWPRLQRIPARVVGLGFRSEHVRSPSRG